MKGEYENVKQNLSFNNNDPGTALSNFKIVNRALKRWELGLDKKEVADILMEQPGAAAAVVMNIKRKKEMKPPPPYPAYKDAIKSLRPKEYKRQAIGLEPEDPIEKSNDLERVKVERIRKPKIEVIKEPVRSALLSQLISEQGDDKEEIQQLIKFPKPPISTFTPFEDNELIPIKTKRYELCGT
jgi:hypothetical protein